MIPDDLHQMMYISKLRTFLGRSFPFLDPGKFLNDVHYLRAMCHHLERVEHGAVQRLIIELPPRHLKSVLTSTVFPAWSLGRDPTKRIVCVSYSNDLAQGFSTRCRALMQEPFYGATFPALQFDPKKNTAAEFHTTQKGFRLATSMHGTLTGKGGDIVIIDDPMKAQDTHSQGARDAAYEIYQSTIATRLDNPETGAIIVVGQRLHEDDLIGRLKQTGTWEVLSLPAIAWQDELIPLGDNMAWPRQVGELLDPERISEAKLKEIRADIGHLAFEAEYQQRPVLPGGNIVKLEWFGTYDKVMPRAHYEAVVQSWDTAVQPGISNDYSVCTTWG